MFTYLAASVHEFVSPSTLPGAALCGVVFAGAAWIAGRAVRLAVHRIVDGHAPRADPTVVRFLGQLARLVIYVIAFLSYVYLVPDLHELGGVWLTSVGLVSVVVGIAAQSTLGNLISGVSLLLYRPFRIGDRLQVNTPAGLETGVLETLTLGYTTLQTDDNRRIVIPNSVMASQICINISQKTQRIVSIVTVIVGCGADIERAQAILIELAKASSRMLEFDSCRVSALSDSGVTLTLTAWCLNSASASEFKSDLLEAAKERFDSERIAIAH